MRRISTGRAEEVKFGRLLRNESLKITDLIQAERGRTEKLVCGRHILGIQDTTELNFENHAGRTTGLGSVGNGTDAGIFLHPLLGVDAKTGCSLGFGSINIINRLQGKRADYWNAPIEEKESHRWILSAEQGKETFKSAEVLTIIGDRESDIYELFSRIPDSKTHVLIRVRSNRKLIDGENIESHLEKKDVSGKMAIKIPREIRMGREKREAICAIKYDKLIIQKPKKCRDARAPNSISLNVVEIKEESCPTGTPIDWRLITTHDVNSVDDAKQIINWYRHRWTIEQLFRTLKKQGLNIESTQIESVNSLIKLSIISVCAALKIMQLVSARDGQAEAHLEEVFSADEIEVLDATLSKLEGKTEKQKNPFTKKNLAWGAWIIARLGGWKGYKSEAPPGPITMARGLENFKNTYNGWFLCKDMCIG